MFQFTNTIVLNTLKDAETGLDKVQATTGGLNILRVNIFKKDNVLNVFKRVAADAVAGAVELPQPAGQATDLFRYKLYARLSGSQNSYFANDLVFKGKPFVYEFAGDTTAANIVKLINKIQNLYGDKFLKVTVGSSSVKFTGDNYTMFTEANLEKFIPAKDNVEGHWEVVNSLDKPEGGIKLTPCENGFGTYEQLLKDLRLPTMEARAWEAVNKEELPIPGAKYDQFTIEYCVNRGVMGGDAVGQEVKSKTTHVFFVKQDLTEAFETLVSANLKAPTEVTKPAKAASHDDLQG